MDNLKRNKPANRECSDYHYQQYEINTVMPLIVEIYCYESGIRCIDKKEYPNQEAWERDKLLLKLSGEWVGERIYDNMDMEHFNELSETERNNWSPIRSDFDKEAFINGV